MCPASANARRVRAANNHPPSISDAGVNGARRRDGVKGLRGAAGARRGGPHNSTQNGGHSGPCLPRARGAGGTEPGAGAVRRAHTTRAPGTAADRRTGQSARWVVEPIPAVSELLRLEEEHKMGKGKVGGAGAQCNGLGLEGGKTARGCHRAGGNASARGPPRVLASTASADVHPAADESALSM